ncbi:arylsulfatase [Microbacterium sp.]|uniref:arylsulfatase n=1 Tax=Microbacterium sp. TaxID=51671 RepID=UPI003A8AD544
MDPIEPRGYETFSGTASEFFSESVPAWRARTPAPPGAPNVVVMLVDDLGFSDLGPYGSEIPTPHIDALARDGWTFTNYRTAPMCSPARAALLTGLNPHRAGFGFVSHTDPGFPGYACEIPENAPTLAESLRAGGYATFMVGKWHLTREQDLHDGADKSSWPLQRGFDRYFGAMDGFTSLHHPHRLIRDNSPVAVESYPEGYFLTDEMTREALGMIHDLRANDPAKPFFLYYAHTSVHGPIQAQHEDIEKQRGRYEAGWNRLRDERFARQRRTGVVPPHAQLPPEHLADADRIPDWDTLTDDERRLFACHMEAYAAAVVEIDRSVGTILADLASRGEADNTIFVVASDNGGTAEGGPSGTRSYFAQFAQLTALPDDWVRDVPREPTDIGGPTMFAQYPAGWARVSNTPFRSFKATTYEGGVHAPLVVSWPRMPAAKKGPRDQFVFVSDLSPTILELTGVPPLSRRAGRESAEVDGSSVADILRDPAADGRESQYFECVGRRAYVADGWKLVSPVAPTPAAGAAGGTWELYELTADPTEVNDLAAQHPERVATMARAWRASAWHNTVFPLDDNGRLHLNRPDTDLQFTRPMRLLPFRPALERWRSSMYTHLKSFLIEADLTLDAGAQGVIVAHGDQGGGYLLAIDDGAPLISYNAYGDMHRARGPRLAEGSHRIILRFDEVEGLRWRVELTVDGERVAGLDATVPMMLGMAPFTGISVGYDFGGPVDGDLHRAHGAYRLSNARIDRLQYVPGAPSTHDPLVLNDVAAAVATLAD